MADSDAAMLLRFDIPSNSDGLNTGRVLGIVCLNPSCEKLTLTITLSGSGNRIKSIPERFVRSVVLPKSKTQAQPDYIPRQIVDDYSEAKAIADLSPKASATLSRRCLQGMIRDFHGISKTRLIDEIAALQPIIPGDVWQAIDAVRRIGNIGAHMERDINLIVEVDAAEADALVGLIEMLFKEWYVARHERSERLQAIVQAADSKKAKPNQLASSTDTLPWEDAVSASTQ